MPWFTTAYITLTGAGCQSGQEDGRFLDIGGFKQFVVSNNAKLFEVIKAA